MLENAFEAKTEQNHYVIFCIQVIDSYCVFSCKNKTATKGNNKSFKNLKSTKQNPMTHGIGTRQIQNIAEKTGGFVTYKHENYEFSALVMLGIKDD